MEKRNNNNDKKKKTKIGKEIKENSIVQIRKMSSSSPQGQILINDE